ncbi:MAG TPA: DUF1028 domain-containing protein [Gaiellaceae bacterium]|nr:DUF1028 domain-containing protein [Gaiellaceae bacterium]
MPQIAVEGQLDVEGALVLDEVDDGALRAAFDDGRPIVVRAATPEAVLHALKRPEVSSVLVPPEKRELLDLDLIKLTYGTYSIAACDLEAGQWGVATQSKFLAVGSVVPWAEPHVGAIATQAYANPRYGPEGLALLREGLPADEVVQRLTSADDGRDHRQLGLVDGEGRAATYTGSECLEWAGGRTGSGYAAQGNILVSGDTVDALAETFERTAGAPLAERFLDCLDAAQAAGGDSRGQQSAALLIVEKDGGYANLFDVVVDLRVDDHERPLEELRRLYGLHQAIYGVTPRDEWVPVDEELAAELRERLARLGYEGELDEAFGRWAGTENLEERVDGVAAIDPIVLDELRRQS